jgi:hypothetical protein
MVPDFQFSTRQDGPPLSDLSSTGMISNHAPTSGMAIFSAQQLLIFIFQIDPVLNPTVY